MPDGLNIRAACTGCGRSYWARDLAEKPPIPKSAWPAIGALALSPCLLLGFGGVIWLAGLERAGEVMMRSAPVRVVLTFGLSLFLARRARTRHAWVVALLWTSCLLILNVLVMGVGALIADGIGLM